MFASAVQPGIVSIFSSTGSDPLALFSSNIDHALPSDSFMCLLNDSTSQPPPPSPAMLISGPTLTAYPDPDNDDSETREGYTVNQTILHMQSPTLPTTYIRSPPNDWSSARSKRAGDLGINHPWIHIQVRNVGREWSFEVGVVDRSAKEGIIRCSTFQKQPSLKLTEPPLLHLPLSFPSHSSRPLTGWCTVTLNLPSLLPHFSSANLMHRQDEDEASDSESAGGSSPSRRISAANTAQVPSGTYSHVSYVKVYATCRLRRIWFSNIGPGQNPPWEFQLYAAS